MNAAESRQSIRGRSALIVASPLLLILVAGAVALSLIGRSTDRDTVRDADLCPVDVEEIRGSVTFLFDFRKPIDGDRASVAGDLLKEVSLGLAGDTEMRMFFLTGSEGSPRALLQRLCKPYDNADILVETAKDHLSGVRDCDDLPAQLPAGLRESATRFCVLRDAVRRRLDTMAARSWSEGEQVDSAYLVEALEDTRLDVEERPPPHSLYLFSDMMHHAHWYSHIDLEWTGWNYGEFAELLRLEDWILESERKADTAGMRVEVFYVPRAGLTDQPRVKRVHQQFWREYFADGEVVFHDQPPMRGYSAKPLMNVLTEVEKAAQERAAAELLLRQVKEEQQALEREQRELQRQTEVRQREQERQREEARRQEEERQREEARQREEERQRLAEEERAAEGSPARQQSEVPGGDPTLQRTTEDAARTEVGPEAGSAAREDASLQAKPTEADPVPSGESAPPTEVSAAPAGPPPCELRLAVNAGGLSAEYPRAGRMNFGEAVITVSYVVDESGETVDGQVEVVLEESRADRERYFDLFAASAIDTVRSWTFAFVDPDDGSCVREQQRKTAFQFTYR